MLNPTLGTDALSCFAQDYQNARRKFLDSLGTVAMAHNHQALCYSGQGPLGESLYTDVIWIGSHDAPRVLVLISATHGVEGFAGSAIQVDMLKRLQNKGKWPQDLALLIIHALNPWGFAWLRRCNETGIDLNRNFIDFDAPLPTNKNYELLADAIIPTDTDWSKADQKLKLFLEQQGQREYELAVSGGQYCDPQGLFFGGHQASQARLLIEHLMQEYILASRRLAVIDLHTGLGPFGYGEIICDHPSGSAGTAVAQRWYGDAVTLPAEGTSTSVPKHGLMDYAWHAIMNTTDKNSQSSFVTLEFGTYSIEHMFEALRWDHWLHAHGAVDWRQPGAQDIKARIRKQFYPDTPAWQAMVLFQGRQTIDMAIRGLLSD